MTKVHKNFLEDVYLETIQVDASLVPSGAGDSIEVAVNPAFDADAVEATSNTLLMTPATTATAIALLNPPADGASILDAVSLLGLLTADVLNTPITTGRWMADSFDDLVMVDVANATNLNVNTPGTLRPVVPGGVGMNTICMLHFEGADASTSIIDSSAAPRAWVANGTAKLSTANPKFGSAAVAFTGASAGYILLSGTDPAQAFGTGDFTIDFWLWKNVATALYVFDTRPSAGTGNNMYMASAVTTNVIQVGASTAVRITGTIPIPLNTWTHVAVVRSAGVTKLYVNGVKDGADYVDATNYVAALNRPLLGGAFNGTSAPFNGYIDEFRMSNVARWLSDFTPPTAPYIDPPMISAGAGTLIGNMTDGGGLAAAFDGVLVQNGTVGAYKVVNADPTGWVGKNFSAAPKRLAYARFVGAANSGFDGLSGTGSNYTLTLYGKNGAAPTTATGGTIIGTATGTDGNGIEVMVQCTDPYTYWDHIWAEIATTQATNARCLAELQLFEPYTPANVTVGSLSFEAAAIPTNAKGLLFVREQETATPNTDYSLECSRDGGVTWTVMTLVHKRMSNYPVAGVRVLTAADTDISSQPSGVAIRWRWKTLTNKHVYLEGVELEVRVAA